MRFVAVFEAKNRFSELLSAVEHGEEITITRHGAPIARLVAMGTAGELPVAQSQRVSNAMQRMRTLGSGAELGCTVKQAIQEGRE
ncbi:type II toxin-antitoxin system Phd/YefM family antitoxin [Rhodoferax ferrireducens]|uniref:type II toxin-antitoxin system Phd/YefM family antitoxin n=1 Tax=Rhodoferax ferrireducens TaxID=192843 RepID=UPI003BB4F3C4